MTYKFNFPIKHTSSANPYIVMKKLNDFFLQVKNFLFPADCALCGVRLIFTQEIKYGLCKECFLKIAFDANKKCRLCGKPLISEIDKCLPCSKEEAHSFDRQWTLYPYTGIYREIMKKYKFEKTLPLADFFAEKLNDILNDPLFKDACIVPVPPRPGKIKESGWDQVDYLIKRLSKINGAPVTRCLKRRKSKIQKQLNRMQRMENLKGRIYINRNPPKTALLIDDVTTTGSTIEVCSSVLKENGTETVYAVCLFYD